MPSSGIYAYMQTDRALIHLKNTQINKFFKKQTIFFEKYTFILLFGSYKSILKGKVTDDLFSGNQGTGRRARVWCSLSYDGVWSLHMVL